MIWLYFRTESEITKNYKQNDVIEGDKIEYNKTLYGALTRWGYIYKYAHYVRVKSNRDQAPPGNLTFEKIIGQMPARTGRNHSQMPCYRGSPGSGILAKIKFNKYFKIRKNEK
jgi:hypothetical protein